MSTAEHRKQAGERIDQVRIAWITVSDTRTEDDDESARLAASLIEAAGYERAHYTLIPNDAGRIEAVLQKLLGTPEVEAICFSGGTGIGKKDQTYDTVVRRLERELTGFGELFRMLSYEEIGPAAMLSRATLGVVNGKLVASLPGSKGAVRLALEKLLLPELRHLVWELRR